MSEEASLLLLGNMIESERGLLGGKGISLQILSLQGSRSVSILKRDL